MNKKVVAGVLGVGILSLGTFTAGTALGNTSWTVPVMSQANKVMAEAGQKKVNELTQNNNVGDQMKVLLNPEIEKQQKEMEKLLEDYYRMKLEGLTDTPEYKLVEEKIAKLKIDAFNRYKEEIDAAFK